MEKDAVSDRELGYGAAKEPRGPRHLRRHPQEALFAYFPCECMYFDDTCAYPMSDCSSACMSACILDCICAYSMVGMPMYSTIGALSSTDVIVGRHRAAYKLGHHPDLASFMT